MLQFDKLWPKTYDLAALREGWAFFNADGVMDIERIDEPEVVKDDKDLDFLPAALESDDAARSLIVSKALGGSKMHALALLLDGRQINDDDEIWVPSELY